MYQTCTAKIILAVTWAPFRKVHPRLNTSPALGLRDMVEKGEKSDRNGID